MSTKYLDFYKNNIEYYYLINEETIKNYSKIESSMLEFLINTEKDNKIKLDEEMVKNIREGLKLAFKFEKQTEYDIKNKNLDDLLFLIGINKNDSLFNKE